MSSLVWTGLDDLRAELRALPSALAGEASAIVMDAADRAKAEIGAVYQAHAVSSNLANHLYVTKAAAGPYGAGATVKSSAKHAWLFDNGSQARHWLSGKSTGTMWGKTPPTHVFVATVIRTRRAMYAQLKALLVRHGLTVSGEADSLSLAA